MLACISPVIVELLVIVDKSWQTDESTFTRADCTYKFLGTEVYEYKETINVF